MVLFPSDHVMHLIRRQPILNYMFVEVLTMPFEEEVDGLREKVAT